MSNFYRPATTPRAKKRYVCEACGWYIPIGEKHMAQTGVFDGHGFSNRFHDECWDALSEHCADFEEFCTGDIPVPDRFKAEVDAARAAQARPASERGDKP